MEVVCFLINNLHIKYFMKTILKIVFGISLFCLFMPLLLAQETAFEINIADDSLNIMPELFINQTNNGTIGLVLKAPLYQSPAYYTSYLYKISNTGDTVSYEFSKQDTILSYYEMIRIDVGEPGYMLSGLCRALDNNLIYTVITRLDSNLNIMWEKIYRFNYYYSVWKMRMLQLKDSSFLYCCSPNLSTNMFLLKLSYEGDSMAFRNYEGDSAGWIQSITYNADSIAYWLHNQWGHYHPNQSSCSCIVVDENLEQTGYYDYGSLDPSPYFGYFNPFSSKLMPNGSLITAGRGVVSESEHTYRYVTVIKYDSLFNPLYMSNLTNPDTNSRGAEVVAVDYYDPSCIYVAGVHNLQGITGNSPSWIYVAKMNDTLGIEFEKYIGGDDYYITFSVTATKDGGVLLTSTRSELGAPMYHRDVYIIKLDSTGCFVGLPENSTIQIKDVLVYPNPGKEKLMVRTALKNCIIRLFDMNGAEILLQPLDSHITEINTRQLTPGTYVYVIQQNNKIVDKGKWIKQ